MKRIETIDQLRELEPGTVIVDNPFVSMAWGCVYERGATDWWGVGNEDRWTDEQIDLPAIVLIDGAQR